MKLCRIVPVFLLLAVLNGCQKSNTTPAAESLPNAHDVAKISNEQFLSQKTFDPWILTNTDPNSSLPCYWSDGKTGYLVGPDGTPTLKMQAGDYVNGQLASLPLGPKSPGPAKLMSGNYSQTLNLQTGVLTTSSSAGAVTFAPLGAKPRNWLRTWQTSDIVIDGDPEAQQVTHANLFYLLSSVAASAHDSIPPMGLSSTTYSGHIFWDADVWMFPALVAQHPQEARSIVDYRFRTLGLARRNAKAHGFAGAEYAWESADTGAETAPAEFARERHITADAAFAAWQYYLWTGDKAFLKTEGGPIIQANAQYWASRARLGADGKYHISDVLSPDETAGLVSDDAYTNGVVRVTLMAATESSRLLGSAADPKWALIAQGLAVPRDSPRDIPAENTRPLTDRFASKQADTLLLIHPLNLPYDAVTAGKMLDFYAPHTIVNGPAMTVSIHAVVAARLGRAQQSLDYFHDAYRPFMRAPWDAFSEKRTTSNVYFLTGMAGCLQSVLYGFGGLRVALPSEHVSGTKLADDGGVSLYADPHLPPGWRSLTIKGIQFHGRTITMTVTPGNHVLTTVSAP